ncbi:MAG: hypothetical protein H7Y60_06440 [Rhodospirillaceae bacterium]|nr:hypothetical protein [Rhodospirillales bacterium]
MLVKMATIASLLRYRPSLGFQYAVLASSYLASQLYMLNVAIAVWLTFSGLMLASAAAMLRVQAGAEPDRMAMEIFFAAGAIEPRFSKIIAGLGQILELSYIDTIKFYSFLISEFLQLGNMVKPQLIASFVLLFVGLIALHKRFRMRRPQTMAAPDLREFAALRDDLREHGINAPLGISAGSTFVTGNSVFLSWPVVDMLLAGKQQLVSFTIQHEFFHHKVYDPYINRVISYLSVPVAILIASFFGIIPLAIFSFIKPNGALAFMLLIAFVMVVYIIMRQPYFWFRCCVEHLADRYAQQCSGGGFPFEGKRSLPLHPQPIERREFLDQKASHYHALLACFFLNMYFLLATLSHFFDPSFIMQHLGVAPWANYLRVLIGPAILAHLLFGLAIFHPTGRGRAILVGNSLLLAALCFGLAEAMGVAARKLGAESVNSPLDIVVNITGDYWVPALIVLYAIIGGTKWKKRST